MKKRLYLLIATLIIIILTGCAGLDAFISSTKGELIGNKYTVWEYDNFGNRVMTIKGDKIALSGTTNDEGEITSSYIDITIDGHEWNHVGGTLVFCQNGVDMITDFQTPGDIINDSHDSSGLIAIDRVVNNYKNLMGKERVVLVYSQTGAPICMFQGDECYEEVPEDIPKTTMLSIDGKLVYVHRANIDIIDAELIN